MELFKYELKGFSKKVELDIEYSIRIVNELLNSQKNSITSYIRTHKKFDDSYGFEQTQMNNHEALSRFMQEHDDIKNKDISFILVADYKRFGRARAYTYPSSNKIYFRVRKVDFKDTPNLVNTLVHEYCHKVGLTHSFKKSSRWPKTAPYSIGNYFEELVRIIINKEAPVITPKKLQNSKANIISKFFSIFKKITGFFF